VSNPDKAAPFKFPSFFFPKSAAAPRFVEIYEIEEEAAINETDIRGADDQATRSVAYHNKLWVTKNNVTYQPQYIYPPDGYSFSSDWKIDIGNQQSLDSQGWIEYVEAPERSGGVAKRKRRRRWVRSIQPTTSLNATSLLLDSSTHNSDQHIQQNLPGISSINGSTSTMPPKKKRKKKTRMTRWMQAIENDFNFKGFGFSIYKSVISKEAFGVGLRIPLSLNFDSIERCPYIPVITSSCSVYYPWTAAAAVSVSMPCEVLRYVLLLAIQFIQRCVLLLTLMATNVKSQAVVPAIDVAPLRFSKNVQERIDVNFSWRLSKRRGYEFKVSSWYIFLPTLVYLHQTLASALQTILPSLVSLLTKTLLSDERQTSEGVEEVEILDNFNSDMKVKDKSKIHDWLRQRTASLGLAAGFPTPDYPGFSCNLICNLSGYYYSMKNLFDMRQKKTKKQSQQDTSTVSNQLGQTGTSFPTMDFSPDSNTDESIRKRSIKTIDKKVTS